MQSVLCINSCNVESYGFNLHVQDTCKKPQQDSANLTAVSSASRELCGKNDSNFFWHEIRYIVGCLKI
jgi:hypothetical protein